MKKQLFYKSVFQRKNLLKSAVYDLATWLASYPRLMLEVFIRKNFGERYFSLASCITILVLLLALPLVLDSAASAMPFFGHRRYDSNGTFWLEYATWYIFLCGFAYCAFLRWREVRRNPSVFDFERFSLSTGIIDSRFFNMSFFGKKPNARVIEIYCEPGLFFIIGLFLWFFGQPVGNLLMVSSVFYAFSYAAAYKAGDNFVMDKIDQILLNADLYDIFVNDKGPEGKKGIRFYGRIPTQKEHRQEVYDFIISEDEDISPVE